MVDKMRHVSSVWDLTLEEIEEMHSKRHLNNYVHAGLLVLRLSAWSQKPQRLRHGLYQSAIENAANGILAVPDLMLGNNPSSVRIRVTRGLWELYSSLPEPLPPDQVPEIMRLFAALAFVVLKAERDDGMPLWIPPPIRKPFLAHERTFQLLLQPFCLESLVPIWQDEFNRTQIDANNHSRAVFLLIMRSVQAILIMIENGMDHDLALTAFTNLENAMLDYEHKYSLDKQHRYRNTLYLYGGNMLQRMGKLDQARSWYLKEIDDPNLPKRFHGNGYMIPLKTCERLISACEITEGTERLRLVRLTDATLAVVLGMARSLGREILAELDRHPEADLRPAWIKLGDRSWLFGGEGCREPLLAALLYQKMVRGIPYAKTDYSILVPVGKEE